MASGFGLLAASASGSFSPGTPLSALLAFVVMTPRAETHRARAYPPEVDPR